ncbi:hypothetical protein GQ457_13G012650 [Hibiscus cannabinus]
MRTNSSQRDSCVCWDIIRKNELQQNNKILCPTRDPCTRTENRRKSKKVLTLSSLKISKYSLFHPNNQESKVWKHLPENQENRTTPNPGARKVGAQGEGELGG